MRASIPMCWSRSCSLPRPIWAAARLAVAIERVAEALLVEDEPVPQNGSRHRACTRGDASMMPALKIERCEQFYTDTDARSAQTYSYGALSHQPPTQERPRTLAMSSVGVCLV